MQITDEMLYESAAAAREIWLSDEFPEGIPEHRFSRRFNKKMRRLIREQKRTPRMNRILRSARRAAIFLLVLAIASFSCLMTAEAYRQKIVEIVKHVYEELTIYQFESSDMTSETAIELGTVTLGFVPDGMEKMEEDTDEFHYSATYKAKDGSQFLVECQVITGKSDAAMIADTENAVTETCTINSDKGTIFVKNQDYTIMWTHENILMYVHGNFSMDILKQIAENIKIE